MTNLQNLTKRIQELVPEIMEPTECYEAYPPHGHPGQSIAEEDCPWCRAGLPIGSVRARPISLADVLKCLPEKYSIYRVGGKGYFSSAQEDISLGFVK